MTEEPKRELVNGQPVEDPDETTDSQSNDGSGDVPSEGDSGQPQGEAGAGPKDDQTGTEEPGSVGFDPPGSVSDIKSGITDRFDRLKKDGPEPIRQAAKGVVDKLFDAIDSGMERWFGGKK
jgi:hypothetical protein|tara:strand:+ start:90 stop:452 length:363 start_codon:yes stop_codon:yes gene_type:complete